RRRSFPPQVGRPAQTATTLRPPTARSLRTVGAAVLRWIAPVGEADRRGQKPRPRFQQSASLPEDPRSRAFQGARRVSRRTREGRILVPVILGQYPSERVTGHHGPGERVRRQDGQGVLLGTGELPEGRPPPTPEFMGVDLGVERLATDSDGKQASGARLEPGCQQRHNQRPAWPPAAAKSKAKGQRPKSIRRKLRSLSGKEARFRRDTNPVLSKPLAPGSSRHPSRNRP